MQDIIAHCRQYALSEIETYEINFDYGSNSYFDLTRCGAVRIEEVKLIFKHLDQRWTTS